MPILLIDAVTDGASFFKALGKGSAKVHDAVTGITATEAFDGGDIGGTITNSTTLHAKFDDGVIINRNAPPPEDTP